MAHAAAPRMSGLAKPLAARSFGLPTVPAQPKLMPGVEADATPQPVVKSMVQGVGPKVV